MVGGFGESLLVVRAELSGRKVDVPSIQFAAELITQMFRFPDALQNGRLSSLTM